MFDNEVTSIVVKLLSVHSDLRSAIEDEDREEALRATKMSALLSMRLVSLMPNMDKAGIKPITAEEMAQLKRDLNSLIT